MKEHVCDLGFPPLTVVAADCCWLLLLPLVLQGVTAPTCGITG